MKHPSTSPLSILSLAYGRLLQGLKALGLVMLWLMMMVIVLDVFLRNVHLPGLPQGLAWSNELCEFLLYLITLCLSPWLLRQGQHIRVDIVLQVLPKPVAYALEWLADTLVLACCVFMAYEGLQATMESYNSGALSIKTWVTPEWWSLAPLPVTFTLLGLEMVWRMQRLRQAPVAPRSDAVSAS